MGTSEFALYLDYKIEHPTRLVSTHFAESTVIKLCKNYRGVIRWKSWEAGRHESWKIMTLLSFPIRSIFIFPINLVQRVWNAKHKKDNAAMSQIKKSVGTKYLALISFIKPKPPYVFIYTFYFKKPKSSLGFHH